MTIAEALRSAARYVEERGTTLAWNGPEMPSEAERTGIIAEVSALGHDLDGLAAASETARVYRREVEAVVGELERRGLTLSPEIAQAVADAFDEAVTMPKTAQARRPPRQRER